MAFYHRIGNSKLKTAYIQFRRCYIQLPNASFSKPRPTEIPNPYSFFQGSSTRVSNSVRFFAAPVQFQTKPKNEEDDNDGPRLNEQIKAKYIRLVRDDGSHSIVLRFEALERARNLKLDLVEVQRDGNPPVCKIMDYHKEMYKRQEKDKERAKGKSETTLRKDIKEVRVSEKTESKDLKMKADMVRKLMDKGYRVKCKATGNQEQNLIDKISCLLALMEDVCVVESGPHLTKKEAFMVVRHIRYGAAKKNGKKWQDVTKMTVKAEEGDVEPLTASSSDSIEYKNQSSGESWFETKEEALSDIDKHISEGNDSISPASLENRYKRAADENKVRNNAQGNNSPSPPMLENRYRRASDENKVRNNAQAPPAMTENRYKRAEPRNRFQQTPPNTGPGIRDADRRPTLNLNRMRHDPVDVNFKPRIENTRQPFNSPSGSRNSMPSREDPRAPNTINPGYGSFSGAPRGPHTAGMHRNREGNS